MIPGEAWFLRSVIPMGRPLRRHAPDTFYLVTSRCHQARFLLRPEPAINDAVHEWLARAQRAFPGVHLFAVCVMSNHLHLLLRDTEGELAAWASYFLGNLARAVNTVRHRHGVVFERRYSAEPILDDEALLDRLAYVINNPVKARLCQAPHLWPGVLLWARTGELESRDVSWIARNGFRGARYRARQRGEQPPSSDPYRVDGRLLIHALPGADGVAGAVEVSAEGQRELSGRRSTMRLVDVLRQDWSAAPAHPERSPRPLCHATRSSIRKRFLAGFQDFVGAFREASAEWRRGNRGVAFPPWSYPPGCPLVRV